MARPDYAGYGVAVNVQGDEPFVTEEQVAGALRAIEVGFDVGTVATPVRTLESWRDPSVVKVVRGEGGKALYFSRATIPFERGSSPDAQALGSERFLRHIGVYAYTRGALEKWVSLPQGELEQIERLEQLRPLSAGLSIGVGVVGEAENGVDTAADLERAAERLRHEQVDAIGILKLT
jgi:3-deoxy-manno-octulosonate cytidylyltransferase (CMP-KDO synthetase)